MGAPRFCVSSLAPASTGCAHALITPTALKGCDQEARERNHALQRFGEAGLLHASASAFKVALDWGWTVAFCHYFSQLPSLIFEELLSFLSNLDKMVVGPLALGLLVVIGCFFRVPPLGAIVI